MTAFTPSDIPVTGTNAITTIEQLHAWSGAFLAEAYKDASVTTDKLTSEVARAHEFRTGIDGNDEPRVATIAYLKLSGDWASNGKKPWANVLPVASVELYQRFKS